MQCFRFVLWVMVLAFTGCGSPQAERWAGQYVPRDWKSTIHGQPVANGYRSPRGTFEVRFPITPNLLNVNDLAPPDGVEQKWKIRVIDLATFRDMYGYDGFVAVMRSENLPPLADMNYDWVVANMPSYGFNGVVTPPAKDDIIRDPRHGETRVMSFGPYKHPQGHDSFRLEALVIHRNALYRVMATNHVIVGDRLPPELLKTMNKSAQASATQNFQLLWNNLTLHGTR